jgi:paraquat-inducible protein A
MAHSHLIACHDCDALFQFDQLAEGERIACPHCDARLLTNRPHSTQRAAAFAIGAACLFLVAIFFPFISLEAGGQTNVVTLAQSVSALEANGSPWLALAVAFFVLGAPALMILGSLYLLLPLLAGARPPGAAWVCRVIYGADEWNMIEVFVIGVLVSLLKLTKLATVILGISFWGFVALMVCLTASFALIDRHELWGLLENPARS